MNSAQATATVVAAPPAPTAAFSFNNVQQPNVATPGHSPAATLASTKEISYGTQQPFNFSYNSTNTSSCQLDTFIAATHDAYWTPWYSTAVPTYHVWPPVALERNYYWWQAHLHWGRRHGDDEFCCPCVLADCVVRLFLHFPPIDIRRRYVSH
jgi:hypothetical protein